MTLVERVQPGHPERNAASRHLRRISPSWSHPVIFSKLKRSWCSSKAFSFSDISWKLVYQNCRQMKSIKSKHFLFKNIITTLRLSVLVESSANWQQLQKFESHTFSHIHTLRFLILKFSSLDWFWMHASISWSPRMLENLMKHLSETQWPEISNYQSKSLPKSIRRRKFQKFQKIWRGSDWLRQIWPMHIFRVWHNERNQSQSVGYWSSW
jgi:hypothetical protein